MINRPEGLFNHVFFWLNTIFQYIFSTPLDHHNAIPAKIVCPAWTKCISFYFEPQYRSSASFCLSSYMLVIKLTVSVDFSAWRQDWVWLELMSLKFNTWVWLQTNDFGSFWLSTCCQPEQGGLACKTNYVYSR